MNQQSLGDFAPTLDQALSQYHTPMRLARRMVEWAGVKPVMRVLEPSAGGGNIVREVVRVGGLVQAVEIDAKWCGVIQSEFSRDYTVSVFNDDFLKVDDEILAVDGSEYDVAVMNPPLTGGVGTLHVKHALGFAPRVVSILRGQDLHDQERHKEFWSQVDLAGLACLARRPVYAGKGGQIETIVVDVRRRGTHHGPQTIEHWADSWD